MAWTSGAFWEFSCRGGHKERVSAGRHLSAEMSQAPHHHKLAQLEDLGELVAHAEKTRREGYTTYLALCSHTHTHAMTTATTWPSAAAVRTLFCPPSTCK